MSSFPAWRRVVTERARAGGWLLRPCNCRSGRLGSELDAAYHRAAAVVAEQPDLPVFDHEVGRQRFKIPPLDALAVPVHHRPRERFAALLPAAELPWARSAAAASTRRSHRDDICRVAGTLPTKAAVATEVIQARQRGGRPTALARALAEVGRISRTIAIVDYVTNPAQRRRILVQLNRQETRHQCARDVFHGRRGHVYQPYRPGQEQQLGALALVTNVLTLWNSGYPDHAVEHLRSEGTNVADEDLEHLAPLQHEQVNLHGRYVFSAPDHLRHGLLRPLTTHSGR